MAQVITFYIGTKAEYQAADNKDPNGIYFISDERAIYKNNVKYVGEEYSFATGSANGTISVNGKDVAIKGLGSAAYKDYDSDIVTVINNSIKTAKTEANNYTDGKISEAKKYADDKFNEVPVATTSKVGIVKPYGEDFDITADGTLSLYRQISVSSFSHNAGTKEIGQTLASPIFTFGFNKVPTSATITNQSNGQKLTISGQSGTSTFALNAAISASTTFRLSGTDSHNKTATKDITIPFYWGKYYGVSEVSNVANVDDSFVQKLTKQLVSGRTGSFTVNAGTGQYIYFAIPASFGTPTFFVGGFEGGFNLVKTFDFTNVSGGKTSYNVYRSQNASLGSTTVEVK